MGGLMGPCLKEDSFYANYIHAKYVNALMQSVKLIKKQAAELP